MGEKHMITAIYHTYPSADHETEISVKIWQDKEVEPKAIVQITHGMLEHKERYNRFAEFLASNGFLVCAHDHLGHGESITSEEKLGFMTIHHPSDVLVEDMDRLRRIMQKQYPNLPYIMLGHSMGSYLLRQYLSIHGYGLSGAIIMGTGYEGVMAPKFALAMIKVLARIFGWDHRSNLMQKMTYTPSYREFDLTGKDKEKSWLTKDLDIVEKYWADPKCTFVFTLSGYKGLMEAVYQTAQTKNIRKIPKELPMLLVSGANDPVGDLGEGVKKVYEKYQKAGLQVNIRLYENDRHEILNELDYELVYAEILEWINRMCLSKM